ncbi:MAG: CHAT domain-containing protein [Bacteroidales bacterium]|nr:CHAT domain-containing protein [Bacteroidales bacterium]
MRKIIVFILVIIFGSAVFAQINKKDIYHLFEYYCEKGLFTNASNMLVEQANNYLNNGDTLTAYELNLKNCRFTDEHLEDFFNHGLTWEGYFSNWYVTESYGAWLGKNDEVAPMLFKTLNLIFQKQPKLLPFYASTLGFIAHKYTGDCSDSVHVFQKALDYIKNITPSKELVKQYIKITKNFYINRFYNSYEGVLMSKNRFDEVEKWYKHNHQYITNLDTTLFKNEIIEYELSFVNEEISYASTIASQNNNYHEAIKMYNDAILILQPLIKYNDTLSQKIASCYANIADAHYTLGDKTLCKEYCDKAMLILLSSNHYDNFDYCDILKSLSLSFFNIKQNDIAARLKLTEMIARENLGWHCSIGDWGIYFMYIQNSQPEKIIENKDFALKTAERSAGGDAYFYLHVGEAFSQLMKRNEHYKDSAEHYFYYAKREFDLNKQYYDRHELSNYFLYSYTEAWADHFGRLGQILDAYNKYKEALTYPTNTNYVNVAMTASYLHKIEDMHLYMPKYYKSMENDICDMLPIIGSLWSDTYLYSGESDLYHIPEWASWNPTDSVSVRIAYDATLLMKGLTLRYNILAPYYDKNPELKNAKQELDKMRDSIYLIEDENTRFLALHNYELKEREISKAVNNELVNVHWADVSNALKNNEACIEFVKYSANTYFRTDSTPRTHYAALVLHNNAVPPIFVDLFDEIELEEMYQLQPKSYDTEVGKTLYSKLWGKLQQFIAGKDRVFFSPMGLLNLINIEMLTDSSGKTAAEEFNLHRVSSTRNIVNNRIGNHIGSVVSFGGVDYKESRENADVMRSINTRGNWAYLQNTLSEVKQIKESLENKGVSVATHTGANATEKVFKQLDGTQSDVIHIASHGYYIPQSQRTAIPYFSNSSSTKIVQDELFYSGLILSGGQNAWIDSTFKPDNNDGILSAHEISKLDLHNVNLVVLSACETGLGDNLFDGIFGLQRAFKKAGAVSILMSLWQIDDKATAEFMKIFYEKLANGNSKHEAYISTVLAMKEKYQDANYWASFILLD